ncbi:hypothetical protein [Aliterella atlantica]|nr:hypothetical protein [Aliterella atlantica]
MTSETVTSDQCWLVDSCCLLNGIGLHLLSDLAKLPLLIFSYAIAP